MTDKATLSALTELLKPLAKSLSSIDHSLSLLADLELAKEFVPDAAKRLEHYAAIDSAVAADAAAYENLKRAQEARNAISSLSFSDLVKLKGQEEADKITAPITDALNARKDAIKNERDIRDQFPALDRIYRRQHS